MVSCFDSAEQRTKLKELEPALLFLTEAEQLLDKLDIHSSLNFAMEIVEERRGLILSAPTSRPLASWKRSTKRVEQKRARSLPRGPRLDGWEQPSRQQEF